MSVGERVGVSGIPGAQQGLPHNEESALCNGCHDHYSLHNVVKKAYSTTGIICCCTRQDSVRFFMHTRCGLWWLVSDSGVRFGAHRVV